MIDPDAFAKQGIDPMSVQMELTQKLVDTLSFERSIVGLKDGAPVFARTGKEEREWRVRDGGEHGEPGLLLRVSRTGMTWCVRGMLMGQSKLRVIANAQKVDGSNDAVLPLAEARKVARDWLGLMKKGVDPYDERRQHQMTTAMLAKERRLTMGVAFGDYIEFKRKHQVALDGASLMVGVGKRRQVDAKMRDPSTEDRLKVQRWMQGSPLWATPVKDLTLREVEASLTPLLHRAQGKKTTERWGPKSVSKGTMDKLYRHLDAAWWWAIKELQRNVNRDMGPFRVWRSKHESDWPKDKRVTSALDTTTDVHVPWLRALLEMQQEAHDPAVFTQRADPRGKGIKPHVAAMVDWYLCLILWGTRATETQLLEWTQVDFVHHLVWLSEDTTKSGSLDVIPLTPWAHTILQERQRLNALWRPEDPGRYVFPSREHGRPISSPRGIGEALAERTGIRLTPHDLRRSLAREIGTDEEMIKTAKLLVAGAALHHGAGRGGSQIAGATVRYLEDKANILRPLFQKRENRIREILGLHVEAPEKPAVDFDTQAILDRARQDPAFRQQLLAAALSAKD